MMKDFFALLDNLNESDRKLVEGYSLGEIKKLEKLYDIAIKGDFLEFMLKMGRCSGGLFGDVPIPLYKRIMAIAYSHFFSNYRAKFFKGTTPIRSIFKKAILYCLRIGNTVLLYTNRSDRRLGLSL